MTTNVLLPLMIILFFSLILPASSREYYTNGKFYRTSLDLTDVPDDIPEDAKEVYLYNNKIRVIRNNSFIHLEHCIKLDLQKNDISEIEPDAFKGLVNLDILYLHQNERDITKSNFQHLETCTILTLSFNKISNIQPGTFDKLINLRSLILNNNQISKLNPGIFTGFRHLTNINLNSNLLTKLEPEIFLNLPRPLFLQLGDPRHSDTDNQFLCDSALCWLKQEEMDGTISWEVSWSLLMYKPKCSQGKNWDTFNCTRQGTCPEPGGMVDATRYGATWPYIVGSVVTYRCDIGYCGVGNITCQGNGEWTDKQSCTVTECSLPVQLQNGTFEPSTGPYKCGTAVTYTCDPGFRLYGSSSMMCTSTAAWDQTVRLCIESNEQETSPVESNEQETSPGSQSPIYVGLGSGIGGSIITAVVVAIVLKRRKKKKTRTSPIDAGYMNPVFPTSGSLDNGDNQDLAQVSKSIQPPRDADVPEYEPIQVGEDAVPSSYQDVGETSLHDVAVIHASPKQICTISEQVPEFSREGNDYEEPGQSSSYVNMRSNPYSEIPSEHFLNEHI